MVSKSQISNLKRELLSSRSRNTGKLLTRKEKLAKLGQLRQARPSRSLQAFIASQKSLLSVEERFNEKGSVGFFRIGCCGDSLTSAGRWPEALQVMLSSSALNPVAVANFGASGRTAGRSSRWYGISEQSRQAVNYRADMYIVLLGVNDAWRSDAKKVRAGLSSVVSKLRTAGPTGVSKVILVEPPDLPKTGRMAANLPEVRREIRSVAETFGAAVLEEPRLGEDSYQIDRVHLEPEGAKKLAVAIKRIVVRILKERRRQC
eukprot:TRINITY_DN83263_c0_g1_i1.p1 TRINITY_DN83263_c0_g1~~TRINITY_DN83263_c0_g1_i1.p1  ORF type:complete len:261 (-),score=36.99 TRINITY_DN83263_c0_g1_i1:314-1096(-)